MKQTVSAGGVVLNPAGQVLVVNQNGNSWSLPKGHVDPGETPFQAAQREIQEESGITELEFVRELGSYQRQRMGLNPVRDDTEELKTIIIFLFRTNQMKLQPEDPTHPEARWVEPSQVEQLLTHAKDKQFFASVASQIS